MHTWALDVEGAVDEGVREGHRAKGRALTGGGHVIHCHRHRLDLGYVVTVGHWYRTVRTRKVRVRVWEDIEPRDEP